MADMRNRTPFYGAVPTSKLNADHVFMADGSTLQEHFPINAEDVVFDNSGSRIAATDVQAAIDTNLIYSTDEVCIGKWIDGKPLYRKTLTLTTTSGENIIPKANISNDLEDITFVFGTNTQPTGNKNAIPSYFGLSDYAGWFYRAASSQFVITCGSNYGFGDTKVTIYYTKSTDSANRSLMSRLNKAKEKLNEAVAKAAAEETKEG